MEAYTENKKKNLSEAKSDIPLVTLTTKSGKTYDVHRDYAPRIKSFVDALEDTGYKIHTIGGHRPGDSKEHGKGTAIDINADDNPDSYPGQPNWRKTNLPDAITKDLMHKKFGMGWGGIPHGKDSGDWGKHRSDTMHFSASNHEGGMDNERWAAYQAKQNQTQVAKVEAPPVSNPEKVAQVITKQTKTADNIKIQPENPLNPKGSSGGSAPKQSTTGVDQIPQAPNIPTKDATSVPKAQAPVQSPTTASTTSDQQDYDYSRWGGGKTSFTPSGAKLYQSQKIVDTLKEELEYTDISNEPGHIPSQGELKSVKGLIAHHSAGRGGMPGLVATGHQRKFAAQWAITRADPAKGIPAKLYRYGPGRQLHTQTSRGVGPAPAGLGNDNTEGVEIIGNNQADIQPEQKALFAKFSVWHQRKHGYDPQKGIFGHSDTDYGHRDDEGSSNAKYVRDNWDKHNDDYDREYKLGKYANQTQVAAQEPKTPSFPTTPPKAATDVKTPEPEVKAPAPEVKAPTTASSSEPEKQEHDYTRWGGGKTTVTPSYKLYQSPGVNEAVKLKTSNAKVLQKALAAAKTEIAQLNRKLKKCDIDEASEVQRSSQKDLDAMGFGDSAPGSKSFSYTYPKDKGESVGQKVDRFKQQDKDIQDFRKKATEKGLQLPEQMSGFLAHMPRKYTSKFPGVKGNPEKEAQYERERSRKAETARHYKSSKYITGKTEEKPKTKG